jgi:hypothetical protein
MRDWKYRIGEMVVINKKAIKSIPSKVGHLVEIYELKTNGKTDYAVRLDDGSKVFVFEYELDSINPNDKILQFNKGETVLTTLGEEVQIVKIDYLNRQVELDYFDGSMQVVGIDGIRKQENEGGIMVEKTGYFEEKGHKLGKLVDEKQAAYGDSISKASKLMKVYLEDYKTEDGYLIPEELLDHILLQVRIIDKQNRIFSNPKADKMNESPYSDLAGYGLLGEKIQN